MTATNHALTGALIGLVVGQPLLAVPAAVLSHFVCDAIPHWTPETPEDERLSSNSFRNYLVVEALLCFLLVVVLAVVRPEHWLSAAVCAFAAASPDFMWIPRYLKTRAGKVWKPNRFEKLAQDIQWFTKPIGAVVEIAWFFGCIILLLPFLRAA